MRAVIYFYGPKTAWAGLVDEDEIIASKTVPSIWLGRLWGRTLLEHIDHAKCGFAILSPEGVALEHSPPSVLGA